MAVIDHAEMLEVLLASCSTWQTLCGVASVTNARPFIHIYECLSTASYPRAIINEGPYYSRAVATGMSAGGGQMWLNFLVRPNATTYTTREARRTWLRDQLQTIRQEMEILSNGRTTPSGYSNSHICLKRISMDCPPFELNASEQPLAAVPHNVLWGAEFSVEY